MTSRPDGWKDRVDRALARAGRWGPRLVVWPLLFAMAIGATAWAVIYFERNTTMWTNALEFGERLVALGIFAGAALLVAEIYMFAALVRRRRTGALPGPDDLKRWHRSLAFTLAGPLYMALWVPAIETDHPMLTLFLISGIAAAVGVTLWELAIFWPRTALPPLPGPREAGIPWRLYLARSGPYLGPAALAVITLGYGFYFSHLALTNHWGMRTLTIDLGLYDNIFYQSIHGNPLGCSFLRGGNHVTAHFDPILVLLSPLYLIYPRAELLLVLQAFWCGAGAIPVYLLGKHHTRSRAVGVALALVYALYPAMQGANMYEFHSLTLMATPLLFALYFLESGATRRFYLILPLVLAVREDAALVLGFVGIYALLTRRRRDVRVGWITIAVSISYFILVKALVMTSFDFFNAGPESYGFTYYFKEMIPNDKSLPDFLISVVTNPAFVVKLVFREAKLIYALQLLLPLLFLPLLARPGRFMLLYGAAFLLLATRKPVYSLYFQYSTVIYPILFVLTPAGLRRLMDWRLDRRGLTAVVGTMVVVSLLCCWKFGGVWRNSSFKGGFKPLVRELTETHRTDYQKLRQMVDRIPPDASLMVSDRVGAHASNRAEVYFYRQWRDVDYVLMDSRDITGAAKRSHNERVRSRQLKMIMSWRHTKLFITRSGAK